MDDHRHTEHKLLKGLKINWTGPDQEGLLLGRCAEPGFDVQEINVHPRESLEDRKFQAQCGVWVTAIWQMPSGDLCSALSNSKSGWVRSTVAACPVCPAEVLNRLARDPSFIQRQALIANPACPPEALLLLVTDDELRATVLAHPNLPDIYKSLQQL